MSDLLGVEQGKRLLVTDGKTDKGRRAGARRSGDEATRRRRTRRAGPHADARPGPGLAAPRGGQCPARGFQMNCRGTRTPGHPPHRGPPPSSEQSSPVISTRPVGSGLKTRRSRQGARGQRRGQPPSTWPRLAVQPPPPPGGMPAADSGTFQGRGRCESGRQQQLWNVGRRGQLRPANPRGSSSLASPWSCFLRGQPQTESALGPTPEAVGAQPVSLCSVLGFFPGRGRAGRGRLLPAPSKAPGPVGHRTPSEPRWSKPPSGPAPPCRLCPSHGEPHPPTHTHTRFCPCHGVP